MDILEKAADLVDQDEYKKLVSEINNNCVCTECDSLCNYMLIKCILDTAIAKSTKAANINPKYRRKK
tara:strand:+ start:23 stop:223 length:201 start_codon:yes stop_codon:yes gene_type:complete